MEIENYFSFVGIMVDIVGVIGLFIWGPPTKPMEGEVGLDIERETVLADGTKVADLEDEQLRRKKIHSVMSKVSLGLICLGFIIQLLGQMEYTEPVDAANASNAASVNLNQSDRIR